MKKAIAIVFSLALLAWPGGFGSTATSGTLPMVQDEDVLYAGQYQVFVVTGVSAKRMFLEYKSDVLVDTENKVIVFLRLEA